MEEADLSTSQILPRSTENIQGAQWYKWSIRADSSLTAGKKFITRIARLLNLWTNDTLLKISILKAIHIMLALLLQKPSKKSKARQHLNVIEKRMKLWEEGLVIESL